MAENTVEMRGSRKRDNTMVRMSEVEVEKYRDVFQLFDKNENGRISLQELGELLTSVGELKASEVELRSVLDELDSTKSGGLNLKDFSKLMARTEELSPTEEFRRVFRVLDRDQDGFISAQDLKEVLVPLGECLSLEDVQEMIRLADKEGNGMVDEKEFIEIMNKEIS